MRGFSRWIRAIAFASAFVLVLSSNSRPVFSWQSDRPAGCASGAYRPTEFPDRIILRFAGDPATSQAVTWRTDASVTGAQAQIARADHGPQFESLARSLPATTFALDTSAGKALCHTVIFEGLKPGTKYLYASAMAHTEASGRSSRRPAPCPSRSGYLISAMRKTASSRTVRGSSGPHSPAPPTLVS